MAGRERKVVAGRRSSSAADCGPASGRQASGKMTHKGRNDECAKGGMTTALCPSYVGIPWLVSRSSFVIPSFVLRHSVLPAACVDSCFLSRPAVAGRRSRAEVVAAGRVRYFIGVVRSPW